MGVLSQASSVANKSKRQVKLEERIVEHPQVHQVAPWLRQHLRAVERWRILRVGPVVGGLSRRPFHFPDFLDI